MTKEHLEKVIEKSNLVIRKNKEKVEGSENKINENKDDIEEIKKQILKQISEINIREIDNVKIQTIIDKKQQLKRNQNQISISEKELETIKTKKTSFEAKLSKIKLSEEQYETLKLEVNELHRSEERNLGVEITTKQRELERTKLAIKQIIRDKQEITEDLLELEETLNEKQEIVEEKEEQAEVLKRKYQKMFSEKNSIQDKVRMFETNLMKHQNERRLVEGDINNLNITKAQITAKKETFEQELQEFGKIEFLNLPTDKLREKQQKTEAILSRIGNVNMRALEEYGKVKEAYDAIKEKVEQLESEKEKILLIIAQIDRKKRKTFLSTLKDVNELFSRNFMQLSTKGVVTLEPQDKKEIFNAGLDIHVKVGAGKYFDVTSLSGGEQTLVALSLIFAVQEFRPYCFYIFDEIDAALDRRNSEKLAYLLKKYMKQGQYLIITHNDSLISESSNNLYGVTMQEGISKILSLEV
jgi:chromosome segregation protein